MVAVTPLHRKGHFCQNLDASWLWQTESPVEWNVEIHLTEASQHVTVTIEGRPVRIRAWRQGFVGISGQIVSMYLLDTDRIRRDVERRLDFPIKSPISGRVLRVFQESSKIANAGERILKVGDPNDLEIEVDVLSTDAVRIRPGTRVVLEQCGGDQSLNGRVRLVEPSALAKVSALCIEEQRVNVIIDFDDPPESRLMLGDGYRVESAIVEWESSDVLIVPTGAVFPEAENWAIFVVRGGKAKLTLIKLGHRNGSSRRA